MPPDEKILKLTGLEKITNRYQDLVKNEVKFRGKIPVNLEYENKKQKMEILITERSDITPLLGTDWMKCNVCHRHDQNFDEKFEMCDVKVEEKRWPT